MSLLVMKFGGSCLREAGSIQQLCRIIECHKKNRLVLVISALGKTTRSLLDAGETAAAGDSARALKKIDEIFSAHLKLWRESGADEEVPSSDPWDTYRREMERLVSGIGDLGEFSPRSRDHLLGYGERLATLLLNDVLRHRGCLTRLFDSGEMIITDENFTSASPLQPHTRDGIRRHLEPVLKLNEMPLLQGFIGSSLNGHPTTLGFEGSDFTAALVGAALEAEEIQIWKDVPGVMTADPGLCPRARRIDELSYQDAALLSGLGAQVLHPATLEPARQTGIPVRVRPFHDPDEQGTRIHADPAPRPERFLSITFRPAIVGLRFELAPGKDREQLLREVMRICREAALPLRALALEGSQLLTAVESVSVPRLHDDEVMSVGRLLEAEEMSFISILGTDIEPGSIFGEILTPDLLAHCILCQQGASRNFITLGIRRDQLKRMLPVLHDRLFVTGGKKK